MLMNDNFMADGCIEIIPRIISAIFFKIVPENIPRLTYGLSGFIKSIIVIEYISNDASLSHPRYYSPILALPHRNISNVREG